MSYIKIHRKVLHSAIWPNINDWRLAETILLLANWTPGNFQSRNGELLKVGRGELVTSIKTLKMKSGLSEQEIRTSLVHLEKADFLTSTSTSHFRVIKIKKYREYQDRDETTNKHSNKDLTRTQQGLNNDIRRSLKKEKKGKDGPRSARTVTPPPRLPNGTADTMKNRADLGDLAFLVEDHPDYERADFKLRARYVEDWEYSRKTILDRANKLHTLQAARERAEAEKDALTPEQAKEFIDKNRKEGKWPRL